jgi:hypothetical protein
VKTEVKTKTSCQKLKSVLPDLLFDPAAVSEPIRQHLESCADCREELVSLQATMNWLDSWTAPEPSPYFNTRMQAKLRTAKEEAPAGFWERLRARVMFSMNVPVRAMGAAALAVMIAVGGGTAVYETQQPNPVQASATVKDLQSLDGNAQVFQQLNALDADDSDSGNSSN